MRATSFARVREHVFSDFLAIRLSILVDGHAIVVLDVDLKLEAPVNAQHNRSTQHLLNTPCCVELKCAQKVQHNRLTQQYTNDHTGLTKLYELPRLREITICISLESRHEIHAT